jgi:ABC-2 type transport system ATP-binding protein
MTIRPSSFDASAPAVSTSGLTRRFGSLVAVDHLDLELPAGEVIGLVGPNGSGKSTLIRMLLGLVRPTSGTAHVLGEPISDPLRYAHRVGALIENPAFVPALSARANLLSLARLRGLHATRVDEVLEVVGLAGRDRESVRRFSLGMKQRLGIAAALLPDPDLLVLDEPTNGLDPAGIVEIRGLLTDLGAQGRTVVVSSHLLSEIQAACDHLVVIRYGELLFNGPTVDLMARSHEHVDVAPEDPGAAEPLAALLHGHGWTGEPAGDVLRLRVHARDSAAVNRAAADAGITLRLLQPARETLEDVFLRMTGPDASPGAASEGRGTR